MLSSSHHGVASYRNGTNSTHAALEHDWPRFFRLVFISNVATLASIGNIFTISAIIVDDLLRKKGNSFLVSTTLADMLITTFVLPASSAAILAQMEDSENLCHFQYGVGSISCLTAAIFTAATGIENFLRLKALKLVEYSRHRQSAHQAGGLPTHMLAPPKQSICTVFQVTILNLILWLISGIIVLIHFIFMPHLMYAICGVPGSGGQNGQTGGGGPRVNDQLLLESVTALGVCLLGFVFLGGLGFLKCICIMRAWDKPKPYLTSREFAVVTANLSNYFLRFLIWCPALVWAIVSQSQRSSEFLFQMESESLFSSSSSSSLSSSLSASSSLSSSSSSLYQHISPYGPLTPPPTISSSSAAAAAAATTAADINNNINVVFQRMIVWPAILPPCLSSLINAIANKDFRRCYVQLFHYCCCKTSVALTRRPRDNLRGGSDVRVHIIPGYNMYSSSAGHFNEISAPPTFRGFKCRPLMNCKRDVYEL